MASRSASGKPASKKPASKASASKTSASKTSTSKTSASKTASKKSASKNSAPKRTGSKKSALKQPAAKKSAAKKKAPAKKSLNSESRAHARRAEQVGKRQRAQQEKQEARRDARRKEQEKKPEPTSIQTGQRRYPAGQAKQHLAKPGLESDLRPRPKYQAPAYRGSGKLEGRVALITGGDSGIGRAVAVLFAREGADVAIAYLDEHSDAEETKRAVEAEGRRAILLSGDVSVSSFAKHAVSRTRAELGGIDILVNNAAYQQHQKSIEDITDEQLDRTFRTNIYGYFYMARAALPHMQRGSVIINTGSVTGIDGSGGLLDYASTKGAIHAFTKSLAQSVLDRGIRVNCVAPGPVWTPLNPADVDAGEAAEFGTDVPMKRAAQPEELAPSYVFLAATTDSSYITGEILNVFGGEPTA